MDRIEVLEERQLLTLDFTSAASFGGTGTLQPQAVTIDSAGNSYVTGLFAGRTSLDTTAAGQALGFTDVFVAKFDPTGNSVWFRHFGNVIGDGTGSSSGKGVALDGSGNVYVAGYYSGKLDFDPAHPGTHVLSTFDGINMFALKLDASGNFGASSYAVGTTGVSGAVTEALGIAVDAAGNATIAGQYEQTISIGGGTLTATASQEPFVVRLTAAGTTSYLKAFVGTPGVLGNKAEAVALDGQGNAYVGGVYKSSMSFGPGMTLVSTSVLGGTSTNDAFVAKIDASGTTAYARSFGGTGQDETTGIAATANGGLAVVGRFSGTATFGSVSISTAATSSTFLARLGPDGSTGAVVSLAVTNTSTSKDQPGVVIDANNDAIVATSFRGAGTVGAFSVTSVGADDVLLAKVNLNGAIQAVSIGGGLASDAPTGIARNGSGQMVTTGILSAPAGFGTIGLPAQGTFNAFVTRFVDSNPGGGGGGTTTHVPGDFDGDGKSDEAVYDAATGTYYIRYSGGDSLVLPFGIANGKNMPVAGDFDGDGKTDITVFDPVTATYYIRYSGGGSRVQQFGIQNGKNFMVPGDFDGDKKTDEAVFDPVTATYYIRYSSGGSRVEQFGVPNGQGLMIPGDYDGDKKTDEAVFDPVTATFYIRYSGGGSLVQQFGIPNGKGMPVPADFDGDGKTDICFYDPGTSTYYTHFSGGGSRVQQFGVPNGKGIMLFGDYDGDGKTDESIFDTVTATYYTRYSAGSALIDQFGIPNGRSTPTPAVMRPSTSGLFGFSVGRGFTDFVALPSDDSATVTTIPAASRPFARRDVVRRFGVGRR